MELYFAPLACSMSARIALAEAGAIIDLVEVDTHAGRILKTSDDYRAINPLGYVPALRLDDGTVLTENSAILQYIAEQYPEAQLAPPASDRVGRAKLRQWLSFISAELHKGLMMPLLGDKTPPEVRAWTVSKYAPRLAYLDDKLKGREFLLDRFSVADGYLATVLNWTRATPEIDLSAYPSVKAYLERMRARPSVAHALATELPLYQAEAARRKAA
jgi:glutathione S-transferase